MDKSISDNLMPWKNADFYKFSSGDEFTYFPPNISSQEISTEQQSMTPLNYVAEIPIATAKSMEGKYFVGTAMNVNFGEVTNGWVRLYNPPDSGVNLHINAWVVSDITSTPFRVQIWFNSTPPGIIQQSPFVVSANTTIIPPPVPKTILQFGVGVRGFPTNGNLAFGRSGAAGTIIEEEEQGRFIFPPGGSFTVYLSNPERPTLPATARVSFGWWEEPIAP
ncbi:DUF6143 family protein [Sedimentibacter sp.]|uniref:DUF6143 family protein n=1 Tax=Sedimentibacter sp. TaxID=1960295 RepID=UPI0028A13D8C|nr:DUF6143 family protein [Sedimentibacter sp.]